MLPGPCEGKNRGGVQVSTRKGEESLGGRGVRESIIPRSETWARNRDPVSSKFEWGRTSGRGRGGGLWRAKERTDSFVRKGSRHQPSVAMRESVARLSHK